MSNQDETLRTLEHLLQGRETGLTELRHYAEQTARQAVSTEAVAQRLSEQQQTCKNHIGELATLRDSMLTLSSQVSSLSGQLGKVLDRNDYKIKWWSVWVPLLVSLVTFLGVFYSVSASRKPLQQEQDKMEEALTILSENQKAVITAMTELQKR